MTKKMLFTVALGCATLLISCKKENNPPSPDPVPQITGISPAQGARNTLVTIRGTGFGNNASALKVYFNNVQGSIQTAVDTLITVTVPASSGSGAVKLEKGSNTVTGPLFTYLGNGYTSTMSLTGSPTNLNFPTGIVRDAGGNLFVCDRDNHRILRITAAGSTTVFAGNGSPGFINGTGSAAQFNQPYCITMDPSGNLYVGDRMNNAIRKITPAGVVTTLAGNGTSGSADGTGNAASFAEPLGITLTASGNLYVSDYGNQKIRKVTLAGAVTTAITGYMTFGITSDASNVIYFTNYFQNRIFKFTEGSNTPILVAGDTNSGTTDGTGAAARFGTPAGITIDATGNLYISEIGNQRIRKITPSGVVTTIAGSTTGYADGDGPSARFDGPIAMAGDFSNNMLYVVEVYNNKIRKVILE